MKFFFYGSLKSGLYNNRILQQSGCTLLKTARTADPEFQLWNLGAYPCVTKGDKVIEGEVWEITNPSVVSFINDMEAGAGYHFEEILLENEETALCYMMNIDPETNQPFWQRKASAINEWPAKARSAPRVSPEPLPVEQSSSQNLVWP